MKKQPNKWLVFSSLVFQIAIIMYFSIEIGSFLDSKYNSGENIYSLLFSVIGIVLVLYLISSQSKRIK